MKILMQIAVAIALLAMGFAAGFPVGRTVGFTTGSEWALIQADLVARDSGMFMPVYYEGGKFRIKYKQPPQLHARAWRLADKHDRESVFLKKCESKTSETSQLVKKASISPKELSDFLQQAGSFSSAAAEDSGLLQSVPHEEVNKASSL